MKRLALDFAPRSLRAMLAQQTRRTGLAVLLGAVLGLGLVLSAVLGGYRLMQARESRLAQAQQDQMQQAREARSAARAAPAPQPALPAAQAAAINRAILQLNLPWRELQHAVALATPASVALLSLEPDAGKRVLRIMAEARSSDVMFEYLRALQQQALFAAVTLTRHEVNEQDANNPVRFQIEAQWVPD